MYDYVQTAYYGVVTQNSSMISTAVDQISLYRDVLRDPNTGLWQHVVLGKTFSDPGLWATGMFARLIETRYFRP